MRLRSVLAIAIAPVVLTSSGCAQESPPPSPASATPAPPTAQPWPSFRGAHASGVSDGHALPTAWNVETGENVRWRTPIPGLAHSSPVVWGYRLFVTTAVKDAEADLKVGLYGDIGSVEDDSVHRFDVMCLSTKTGAVEWTRTAWEGVPAVKRHPKGSHAASSPATDGRHVVAFFGSEGLYCYDMEGALLWKRDFGVLDSGYYRVPEAQWGFASSPVIHGDVVLVQCDVQSGSFVAALSLKDGADLWRTARDEVPTWCSPTVDVRDGRSQVILNGYKHIGGYDLATGAELWHLVGGGDIPVPTPIVAHDLIFIMNAHGRLAPIYAINPMATGTITGDQPEHVAWWTRRGGNYMQTPIVYGPHLYACSDAGIVTCYDAVTGEQKYRQRLAEGRSGFAGSLVAGDGKLFATSEEGLVYVIRAGEVFATFEQSDLGETCMATPAIVGGTMYWRTRKHVIAIGE